MRRNSRLFLFLLTLILVFSFSVPVMAGSTLYVRKPMVVMGYYTVDYPGDRLSQASLAKYGQLVSHVSFFDYSIDYRGNLKGTPSLEGIGTARKAGAKTLMVVHNFVNGSFDHKSAGTALSVPSYRKKLVDNIVSQVDKHGYSGVNIDLEGIPPSCRQSYNLFLDRLRASLKARSKLLTVAVPAKTADDPGNSWSGGYDYRTIGRLADYVALMTYDEHWAGGPPGPVASVPWVEKVLKYSTGVIPSGKILMGVACYGYDWAGNQRGKAVKWKDVQALISRYGGVSWNNYYSVPKMIYYKSGSKHQVWFENRYSFAIKLNLAKKYGLGGIAMWRMGFEDQTFWDTLKSKL